MARGKKSIQRECPANRQSGTSFRIRQQSDLQITNLQEIEVRVAYPFAQNAKGWGAGAGIRSRR